MDKTTKEVAEILGISLRQVQTLIQKNRLPAEKRGRDYFIKEKDIELVRERPITGRPQKWVSFILLELSSLSKSKVINLKELDKILETVFQGKSEPPRKIEGGFVLKYNFDKPLLREDVVPKINDLFATFHHNLQIQVGRYGFQLIDD